MMYFNYFDNRFVSKGRKLSQRLFCVSIFNNGVENGKVENFNRLKFKRLKFKKFNKGTKAVCFRVLI